VLRDSEGQGFLVIFDFQISVFDWCPGTGGEIENRKSKIENPMSNRTVRVNELVQRELSDILRKRYQSESVAITITEVRVTPDLHDARVFVSVIGNDEAALKGLRWIQRKGGELRYELGRRIVLKFLPKLEFVVDESVIRGTRILKMLDDLGPPTAPAAPEPTEEPR
jgi:ribosome-binding factor A